MRYTTLRVTGGGVLLLAGHRARLAPEGDAVLAAFDRFASAATPGVYALTAEGGRLAIERRDGSGLHDGMPARYLPSPIAALAGPIDKPHSPCPFDAVRLAGVATLLTDALGTEVLESCRAAVIALEGGRLVAPPPDRPVVRSVTLAALAERMEVTRQPIPVAGSSPLLLLNAVAGACVPHVSGRAPFPPPLVTAIRAALGFDPAGPRAYNPPRSTTGRRSES